MLFDGSFAGLLSAAAYCFRNRVQPEGWISAQEEQPLLDCLAIPQEKGVHQLFERHFRHCLGPAAGPEILDTAWRAFCSEQAGMAAHIWVFLSQALRLRQDPGARLFEPDIAAVVQAARRVSGQAHQFLGLLRFREIAPAFYLADFAPDYHLLPFVWPHFADRLPDQCFAIRDLRRRLAAFHPAGGPISLHSLADDDPAASLEALPAATGAAHAALLASTGAAAHGPAAACAAGSERLTAGATENASESAAMWRRYLQHLSIPERRSPSLQQANMPRKYWKCLTEDPGSLT
jgi:probable DNA metabolism protein